MIIYKEHYEPFIMGGDVHKPISTDIEVGEKLDLGKGFFGYLVVNPNNDKTYVVEAKSGGIIGPSLAQVKKDIEDCDDIKVMKKQIKEAKKRRDYASKLEPEEFWGKFRS